MGQEDSTLNWQVETKDGNQFIGNILLSTKDSIKLKTASFGTLDIARREIKSIQLHNEIQKASYGLKIIIPPDISLVLQALD